MRSFVVTTLLLATAAAHAQLPREYRYEFELNAGGKNDRTTHGTVRVAGDRARVDTDDPDERHDYFLLANGGQTVYVVHPDRRTYEEHDADDFARVVGTAMRAAGPVLRVTVKDAQLDTLRLGAGGVIAGRRTVRTRLSQRWTMSMRVLGFVNEDLNGSSVADYWADPSLKLMRNSLLDIVSTSLMALAASDESFLDRADAARARLYRGSPLRAEIRLTMSKRDDRDDETTLRYEVTRITPSHVNADDVALPKGYRRTTEHTFRMKR